MTGKSNGSINGNKLDNPMNDEVEREVEDEWEVANEEGSWKITRIRKTHTIRWEN